MSRILDDFLKSAKGRMIFVGVQPTPGGNKAGSEGIREKLDEVLQQEISE